MQECYECGTKTEKLVHITMINFKEVDYYVCRRCANKNRVGTYYDETEQQGWQGNIERLIEDI